MVSRRILRLWHNLLLHDLRKVSDIEHFINFGSALTEQYTIGVRLGYFIFLSGYWSINSCHLLETHHFNDLIGMLRFDLNFDVDIDDIREKTADIEMPEHFLPVFLFCAADQNVHDFDKDIEPWLMTLLGVKASRCKTSQNDLFWLGLQKAFSAAFPKGAERLRIMLCSVRKWTKGDSL